MAELQGIMNLKKNYEICTVICKVFSLVNCIVLNVLDKLINMQPWRYAICPTRPSGRRKDHFSYSSVVLHSTHHLHSKLFVLQREYTICSLVMFKS